ncbi:MAG: DUF5915 domain-containing protein, partial [Gammaproteobacteria bacterium]
LVAQDGSITVALDTAMTDALQAKGFARECVNRIQNMRKQADLNLTDRIDVQYQASERLRAAISEHADWISSETLAIKVSTSDTPEGEYRDSFQLDEETLELAISRVQST